MLRLLRPLSFFKSPAYYPLYHSRNMASENKTPTPAGTHLDPVTGEMISKQLVINSFFCDEFWIDRWIWRELKRREKQRAKDSAKASKAPAAPAESTSTTTAAAAGPNEDDLNPNVSSDSMQNKKQTSKTVPPTAILWDKKSSDTRTQEKSISQPIPS